MIIKNLIKGNRNDLREDILYLFEHEDMDDQVRFLLMVVH